MPQQLFGDIETGRRVVICDMEAGVGAIVRGGKGDVVIAVAEPSVKSIDVARRAAGAASAEGVEVIVVANRVRDGRDLEAIEAALGAFVVGEGGDDRAMLALRYTGSPASAGAPASFMGAGA